MTNVPPTIQWPTPPEPPSSVPGTGPDPRTPLEEQRGRVQRVDAMAPKVYRVQGFITIAGAGASLQDVNFPVKFVELPAYSFGWSLEDGQSLENGNYPRIDIGVAAWRYEDHPRVRYYVGARLAVNSCGRDDQRVIGHWQCEGRCLGSLASTSSLSAEQAI